MADITKCKGLGCPKSIYCYRYTADIGMRQSWMVDVPFKVVKVNGKSTVECEYFWETKEYIELKKKKKLK